MKNGMLRGMVTGMVIGGAAATLFGVMNWQTERRWNREVQRGGRWLTARTDELMKKF